MFFLPKDKKADGAELPGGMQTPRATAFNNVLKLTSRLLLGQHCVW